MAAVEPDQLGLVADGHLIMEDCEARREQIGAAEALQLGAARLDRVAGLRACTQSISRSAKQSMLISIGWRACAHEQRPEPATTPHSHAWCSQARSSQSSHQSSNQAINQPTD